LERQKEKDKLREKKEEENRRIEKLIQQDIKNLDPFKQLHYQKFRATIELMKLSFRRNQIDALLQIYSSIEDLKKRREKLHEIQKRSIFALCQLPTDFGKTAMAAAFVKHGHKENPT